MNMRWWRRCDTVIDIEWSWVAPAERVKRRDLSTWFSIKGCFKERMEEGISLEKVCDMEEYIEEKIWYNWEREVSTKLWLEEMRSSRDVTKDSLKKSCSFISFSIESESYLVWIDSIYCFDLRFHSFYIFLISRSTSG